jgi:GTP pyrophosphokinase
MAALVARHILDLVENDSPSIPFQEFGDEKISKADPIMIYGSEGISVQLAPCCLPIPGDSIIGQLKRDQGLIVHTDDCQNSKRIRAREPDRWIDVSWGEDINRRFDTHISVIIENERGALARVAAEIGEADANISHVGMEEDKSDNLTTLNFTIQVENRVHLARIMRGIKHLRGVTKIRREHI